MTEPQSPEDLRDLCRLRSSLEAFAISRIRKSVGRREVFHALGVQMVRLKTAAIQGDYKSFHREDVVLHRTVIKASGLPALTHSWNIVSNQLDDWTLQVKLRWPSLMALYREHEYLLEAWASSDDGEATVATHHHLETGWHQAIRSKASSDGTAVDRAVSFLSANYARRIDIKWLASNVCFLSPSHLTRLFRAQFGKAPYAWLRQIRMERAEELLSKGGTSLTDVAKQVGYCNVSHFARDFRIFTGTTPGRFRQPGKLF